jgi:hypothetical protein
VDDMDKSLLGEVDPSRLAPFERPVPTRPMQPLAWSIEKYEVAQLLALSRMTVTDVAKATNVPVHIIQKWKQHPEFSEYMNKIVLEGASVLKAKRLMILQKILDARLERAEAMGDFATLSTKDTLDILSEIRKETEDEDSKEKSTWMQTLDVLLTKTAEKQAQLIELSRESSQGDT